MKYLFKVRILALNFNLEFPFNKFLGSGLPVISSSYQDGFFPEAASSCDMMVCDLRGLGDSYFSLFRPLPKTRKDISNYNYLKLFSPIAEDVN